MNNGDFFKNTEDPALAKWVADYHNEVQQLDFGNEA
jgi:hypothetical protein